MKQYQPPFVMREPIIFSAPQQSTQRQLAVVVDQKFGGWPVVALTLWQFNGELPGDLAISAFANDEGVSLDSARDYSKSEGWRRVMTRDEYYMLRISPSAYAKIKATLRSEIREEIISRIR